MAPPTIRLMIGRAVAAWLDFSMKTTEVMSHAHIGASPFVIR